MIKARYTLPVKNHGNLTDGSMFGRTGEICLSIVALNKFDLFLLFSSAL